MKHVYTAVIIIALITAAQHSPAGEPKGIAVVENQYDPVERFLQAYKIPFTMIRYRDLENAGTLSRFRAVFFPCGVDVPIETSINILSMGTNIQSVSLKQDYHEINKEVIYRNVRSFIEDGGIAYFSGYSYDLLQGAFNDFTFFHNFPHMGMSGSIDMSLLGDLKSFYAGRNLSINESYSGWIAIQSLRNAELLSRGRFETPEGEKSGPISAMFKKGRGAAFYTGFHFDDPVNTLTRFYVYRLVCNGLLSDLQRETAKWEQNTGAHIIDVIAPGENFRQYTLSLVKGMNTLYFRNEKSYFQLDIFDSRGNLVLSRQAWEKEFSQDITTDREGEYVLKVYPAMPERLVPYAVIAGHGIRLVPYWRKGVLALIFISVVSVLVWINRIINPRKYSGRAQ